MASALQTYVHKALRRGHQPYHKVWSNREAAMNYQGRSRMFLKVFLLVLVAVAFSSAGVQAGWLSQIRLTNAPHASYLSSNNARCLAAGNEGTLHLVWYDYRDGDGDVYYNKFDGVTWGTETALTTNGTASEYPSIAADESGRLHVVWIDNLGGGPDVYYKMFDGMGWSDAEALTVGAASCEEPCIAVDGPGHVHVVWRNYRDGAWGIYYRVFDGVTWSAEENLTDPACYPRHASIAADDSQHLHVVWEDYRDLNWEIYYKRFDGTSWGADLRLTDDPGLSENPSAVVDSYGSIHVFWGDTRDGESAVYHKVFDGVAWSGDESVVEPFWNASAPVADAGDSGIVHLAWHDVGGYGDKEIYYRKFDGMSWGAIEPISQVPDASKNPMIAVDSDGHPHIVWHDQRHGNFEIYWRSSYLLPAPVFVSISPDTGLSYDEVHVSDLAGQNFFVWADVRLQRAGEDDIVASDVVVESSTRITCDLDLFGAIPGDWDVVVMNQDSQSVTVPSGFEVLPVPTPDIVSIVPSTGIAYESVHITSLSGGGFSSSPSVCLEKAGEESVRALNVVVESPSQITCDFSLGSIAAGTWDVVVTNRDGQKDVLLSGFEVMEGMWSEDLRLTYSGSSSSTSGPNGRSIASDHLGNLHVVWHDDRDGNWEIYYKKYDGTSWGQDERLTDAADQSLHAAIAAGAGGVLHVVWDDYRDGNLEIYYKRYDGSAWLADERLTTDAGDSEYPSIATGQAGRVYVVWMDDRAGQSQIYMKTHDGSIWSSDESIAPALERCGTPAVAVDSIGHVHVAWYNDGVTAGDHLYYQKFDGISWSATETLEAASSIYFPSIAVDGKGCVHVAWHDGRHYYSGYGYEIFYRRFNGTSWDPVERITEAALNSVNASVAADDSGNVHIVWAEKRDGNNEIYYKTHDGDAWGLDIRLTRASNESARPNLAVASDGSLHVLWQDKRHGLAEIYYKTRAAGDLAGIPERDLAGRGISRMTIAPSPTRESARITFGLRSMAEIRIAVLDIRGRLVSTLSRGLYPSGTHSITWKGCDEQGSKVAPGVYFIRLQACDSQATRKIVLLR
ncbi:FlgD immunoglobulin-like domain containing protein [Candidatus Eisenbacteria bacterium]|uniref:FlgD immunoglobulin-like domain containing protein n=1 Tax=Eiseniibacteriota bacterium TaxID=2212470 RepID=A0ABV6YPK8_UNCEI